MPVGVLLNDIDEEVVVVPALEKSTITVCQKQSILLDVGHQSKTLLSI